MPSYFQDSTSVLLIDSDGALPVMEDGGIRDRTALWRAVTSNVAPSGQPVTQRPVPKIHKVTADKRNIVSDPSQLYT